MITIKRGANEYIEDQKCPSCSSEVDKGGRLEGKKRKNVYLKCTVCKYSMQSEKIIIQREGWAIKKGAKLSK